jgi:two-component system sensor histidine kinase ArlS
MKLKFRITLLFTVVVSFILFVVCGSILYFSELNRQRDFKRRLHNRALTTANRLLTVPGIDNELLRRIDQSTLISIQNKSVYIYDANNRELYSYTDSTTQPVHVNNYELIKARETGEYSFTKEEKEGIIIEQTINNQKYTLVVVGVDMIGRGNMADLQVVLIISFFSGILITLITGLVFSSRIVFPIKKITEEVKDISSKNLSRRIDLHEPKDELHELSSTFNDLLTRLEKSFEMQGHFIANASHELSTPLTSISSQLEITLQNERNAEEYKSVISSVYDDVKNLTGLTRSLLEIAKASGTSEGIELTPVRIDELIMKLPSELRKADDSFLAEIHFDSFPENEDNLLIFGNPDLLYSAIKNVATNACKYGKDHTAHISLSFSQSQLNIVVKDNGPGINSEEQKFIFEPFYRGRKMNEIQGFGLGLSLASRIITLHKGKIELSSSSSNGTIFSIHFPVARVFHKI